jgi:hypothetical protein
MPVVELNIYLSDKQVKKVREYVASIEEDEPDDWNGWLCGVAITAICQRLGALEKAKESS